jgi:hypothetical protein
MLNDKSGLLLLDECNVLRKYNYVLVQDIQDQINYADKLIEDLKRKSVVTEETGLNFAFLKFYKERCKNILGVYTVKRFHLTTEDNTELLSEEELEKWNMIKEVENEYYKNFSYIKFVKDDAPPINIYVHILCIRDGGIIYDGDECVSILENRIYFVRQKSIEHLVKDGSVQIINS